MAYHRSRSLGVGAKIIRRRKSLTSICHCSKDRSISLTLIIYPPNTQLLHSLAQFLHKFIPFFCVFHLGFGLVPEEFASSAQEPWIDSRSASLVEESLLVAIKDNGRSVVEIEQAIVEAQTSLLDTQRTQEQDDASARLAQLEAEKAQMAEELAKREQQLLEQSGGAIRLIKTEEHRPLLIEAIDRASSELTLVSAWIRPDAFDDELRRKLAQAINRGVTVRIAWGFGTNWNRSSPATNARRPSITSAWVKRHWHNWSECSLKFPMGGW